MFNAIIKPLFILIVTVAYLGWLALLGGCVTVAEQTITVTETRVMKRTIRVEGDAMPLPKADAKEQDWREAGK